MNNGALPRYFFMCMNRFLPLLLLSLLSTLSNAKNYTLQSSFESLSYSEASAIYQIVNDSWGDKPLTGGDTLFTRNRFSIGMQEKWLSLDYIERYDWMARFTPDTADLVYWVGADQDVPYGKSLDLDLNIQHLAAYGARLGLHAPVFYGIQASVNFSFLNGRGVQEGRIWGVAQQDSENQYVGNLNIYYQYNDDLLLEHNQVEPELRDAKGKGFAVDVRLSWEYEQFRVQLTVEDAWMQMKWENAGILFGKVNPEYVYTHDKTVFGSSSRGLDDIRSQTVPVFTELLADYRGREWGLQVGGWHYMDELFPQITVHRHWLKKTHDVLLGYEFNSNKWRVGYKFQHEQTQASLAFGTDKLNLEFAHALELSANVKYAF